MQESWRVILGPELSKFMVDVSLNLPDVVACKPIIDFNLSESKSDPKFTVLLIKAIVWAESVSFNTPSAWLLIKLITSAESVLFNKSLTSLIAATKLLLLIVDKVVRVPKSESRLLDFCNHCATVSERLIAVSYTHLTLPTICSV